MLVGNGNFEFIDEDDNDLSIDELVKSVSEEVTKLVNIWIDDWSEKALFFVNDDSYTSVDTNIVEVVEEDWFIDVTDGFTVEYVILEIIDDGEGVVCGECDVVDVIVNVETSDVENVRCNVDEE